MSRLVRLCLLAAVLTSFSACIGEDIVEDYVTPVLRLRNVPDTLEAGTQHQLEFQFLNNVGQPEAVSPSWSSSDASVLTVSATGLVSGVAEGSAEVTAAYTDEFDETVSVAQRLNIGASTVVDVELQARSGTVATTSSYELTGEFKLEELEDGALLLQFDADYKADAGLPGLYIYLSNNPRTTVGAHEIGAVTVFNGAHDYRIEGVDIDNFRYVLYFCKPFDVEVGSGEIQE